MSEERARILKLLEDGKIDADQAARLIEAVGARQAEPPVPPGPPVRGFRVRGHAFRQFDRIPEIVARAVRSGVECGEESTKEFAGKRNLFVKTVSGDVTVRGDDAERVRVSYSGGMVKVRSRDEGVQVRSVSGDVEARMPRAGTLEAETVSGDLGVEQVRARVVLKSVSGDVTVEESEGEVEAGTVSGDLELDRFRGRVEVRTRSGDIGIVAAGPVAGRVESKSGDITLELPRSVGLEFELEIEGRDEDSGEPAGEIEMDFGGPVETLEQRAGYLHAKVGSGGQKLVCCTRAGDISIREAEEE